jgi:hypothetical protein
VKVVKKAVPVKPIDPISLKIKELLEYRKKQRNNGMLVSNSMMDFVKRDLI